jgi:hypothetical protein
MKQNDIYEDMLRESYHPDSGEIMGGFSVILAHLMEIPIREFRPINDGLWMTFLVIKDEKEGT